MNTPTFWDAYFSVPTIQLDGGTKLPLRSLLNFEGFACEDDEANKRTNIRATKLVGDDDGVAHLVAAEVVAEGDATVEPRSRVGHVKTTDATPVVVVLRTLLDPEVLAIDIVVTATNAAASKHGRWKLSCVVKRSGGAATLLGDGTDPDALASAGLAAEITVSGNAARLSLTGDAADAITFGFEVRMQKQVMETP